MKLHSFRAAACGLALMSMLSVLPATAGGNSNTPEDKRMWMAVGERRFSVTLADNEAARAFADGNEKHVKLPKALPAQASRPGTIRNGDLMLWGADTLVVFYLTFDSPYAYTRLGRIDDPAELPKVLGPGTARIVFTRR